MGQKGGICQDKMVLMSVFYQTGQKEHPYQFCKELIKNYDIRGIFHSTLYGFGFVNLGVPLIEENEKSIQSTISNLEKFAKSKIKSEGNIIHVAKLEH